MSLLLRLSRRPHLRLATLLLALAAAPRAAALNESPPTTAVPPPAASVMPNPTLDAAASLDTLATRYTQLALTLAAQDPGSLLRWDGPADWLDAARSAAATSEHAPLALAEQARELRRYLSEHPQAGDTAAEMRSRYLQARVDALLARGLQLGGRPPDFDVEARALYGVSAPRLRMAELEQTLAQLSHVLPPQAGATLAQRLQRFRAVYRLSGPTLQRVFDSALSRARSRSRAQLTLPAGEQLELKFVDDGSIAAGYHWLGDYRGQLVVDTRQPLDFAAVLDQVAREGYPGHHVGAVLREQRRRAGQLPVEQQVVLRASPQTLLDEGAAAAAPALVFPPEERPALLAELFALAGYRPRTVAQYLEVARLVDALGPARIEAQRQWLGGRMDETAVRRWLIDKTLLDPAAVDDELARYARERSACAMPLAGRLLVQRYLDTHSAGAEDPAVRWHWFEQIARAPRAPLDLLP